MKLAADASAIVAEALRRRGRHLIADKGLELYVAEPTWSEIQHEIRRRIDAMVGHGQIESENRDLVFDETMALLRQNLTVVPAAEYRQFEVAARARIPRDPNDWPTVAVALALDAGIWTHDYDFFGCGAPVWITQTLTTQLAPRSTER